MVVPGGVSRLICVSAGWGSCCQWGSWGSCAPWRLSVCVLVLAHWPGRPGHVWECVGHPWWEEALAGLGCFWPEL